MKAKQTQDRNNMNDPQKKHKPRPVSKNTPPESANWPHGANPTPAQMGTKTRWRLARTKDPQQIFSFSASILRL